MPDMAERKPGKPGASDNNCTTLQFLPPQTGIKKKVRFSMALFYLPS
jgi:hypothetical protein